MTPNPTDQAARAAARELATFGQPSERRRQWLLIFEDAEVGMMVFDDEAEAHRKFELHTQSWNCTLFATCDRYAALPPANVEAEREAIEALKQIEKEEPHWQQREMSCGCAVRMREIARKALAAIRARSQKVQP